MKTISLKCEFCKNIFDKSLKEYKRRIKIGATKFYCSLRCSGKQCVENFGSNWNNSEENIKNLRRFHHDGHNIKYSKENRPFYRYLRSANNRRQHKCDLDIEYLRNLWKTQNGRCAFSGIPMKYIGDTTDFNIVGSLDRKDSSKGYIKGNVQFVICALNLAKGNRPDHKISELIALILEHNAIKSSDHRDD